MDGISVPSRFSCLKIEDEEFHPVAGRSNKRKPDNKTTVKKAPEKTNGTKKEKTNIKQKTTNNANGASKVSVKKTKSKNLQDAKQWEEWKKKDDEFVDENFQQDLQCAILQSKLDFETHKKNMAVVEMASQEKIKKKKCKTMSLDQFLENSQNKPDPEIKNDEKELDSLDKMFDIAKEEVKRGKLEEERRERNANIEEVITLVQCQEKLKKQMEINEELKKELEEAKAEIAQVKSRNKTLCGMLSQGEMKDKAGVLLELEKLRTVKEELGEEVARLYKLLEQERSLTKANNNSETYLIKHKEKIKRKKR